MFVFLLMLVSCHANSDSNKFTLGGLAKTILFIGVPSTLVIWVVYKFVAHKHLANNKNIDLHSLYRQALESVEKEDLKTFIEIVKKNPEVANFKDFDGNTIFHVAAGAKNQEFFKVLYKYCEGVCDGLDINGDSPLHIAIRKNNLEIVAILAKVRVLRLVYNREGKIPLDLAKELKNAEAQKILEIEI